MFKARPSIRLVGDVDDTAAQQSTTLEVSGLCLSRGSKQVISDLGLNIRHTGLAVIMGPNGAGKSLFLRLIHGLIQPDAGTIRWNGQPMSDRIRLRQAMVFQKPVLLRRSARANIEFVLGAPRLRARHAAIEFLDRVGLADKAAQPAHSLSGGEKQRLSLARALATAPEVLLLDEPTANLDPASTLTVEKVVQNASATGTRVVWVTHDRFQAERIAEQVVFMDRGKVVEHAPAAHTFFERPASARAASYLAGKILC